MWPIYGLFDGRVSYYLFKFIFNWSIIALQYCVGFSHTTTWISHKYTYVPSLLNLIPPLQVVIEHQVELPVLHSNFPLTIFFTSGNVYVSILLSQFIPPSPSPTVSTSLFSMSVSPLLPYKQVHQYHLSRFHIYVNI